MNKIKKVIYKILSKIFCGKLGEKYKQKYLKYKFRSKNDMYFESLEVLKKDIEEVKRLIVLNSIFSKQLSPYSFERITIDEGLIKKLQFSTNPWLKRPENADISEIYNLEYFKIILNLLNNAIGNNETRDIYVELILELLDRVNKIENKIEIYSNCIKLLLGSPHNRHFLEKLFLRANDDYKRGMLSDYLLLTNICFDLYTNNLERAEKNLKHYITNYGTANLEMYLPVAKFAASFGYKNENSELAIAIFNNFEKNDKNNYFEKYIKGKRVAIVGNGPQELGTGNGKKIDSYDVVIRFNDFSSDEEFIKDYGSKTSVWAKCGYSAPIPKLDVDIHATRLSPYLMPMANKLEEYANYIKLDKNFIYFPDRLYRELKENYGVAAPTTGLQMIYWVKKVNPYFSQNDCYGFSFKYENIKQEDFMKHYYAAFSPSGHSLDIERNCFKKMFADENVVV